MTSEPKKNKQLFFLVALPRSGNTLFASIMNQNPDIAATPNSITLEIMKDLFLLKQTCFVVKPLSLKKAKKCRQASTGYAGPNDLSTSEQYLGFFPRLKSSFPCTGKNMKNRL